MANSKCGDCNERIFPRQSFICCNGACEKAFHIKCVNITPDDLPGFIGNDGISKFSCSSCSNLDSQSSTQITKVNKELSDKDSKIDKILETVTFLSDEVANLKEENMSLKLLVIELNNKLERMNIINEMPSETRGFRSLKHDNVDKMMVEKVNNAFETSSEPRNTNSLGQNYKKSYAQATSVSMETAVPSFDEPDLDNEGFKKVTYKRNKSNKQDNFKPIKKPIVIGRNNVCSLSTIKKEVKRRNAIFVSRLAPEVDVNDILKYLKDNIKLKSARCTRLKTRYETYASFHISLEIDEYETAIDPESWPEGVLVSTFYGRLKEDEKYIQTKHDQPNNIELNGDPRD